MPKVHLPDGRIVNFPDGMPPEQISAAVAKLSPVDGGPETYAGGFLKSLGDTALQTAKGVGLGALKSFDPRNVIAGVDAVTNPVSLYHATEGGVNFVKDAVTGQLDPETGGEAIGGLATGLVAPRIGPPIVRGLKRLAPAASLATDVGWGAAKGAASNLPFVSAPVKGAIRGIQGALADRAASEAQGSGRLVPRPSAPTPSLESVLNDIRSTDTVNDAPDVTGSEGAISKLATRNRTSVDPQTRGGMVATLPDKWGATGLYQAGSPELESAIAGHGMTAPGLPPKIDALATEMQRASPSMDMPPPTRTPSTGGAPPTPPPINSRGFLTPNEQALLEQMSQQVQDLPPVGRTMPISAGSTRLPAVPPTEAGYQQLLSQFGGRLAR